MLEDGTALLTAGAGITWRPGGLTLDVGMLRPLDELRFRETLSYSVLSSYLRLSLTIRLP